MRNIRTKSFLMAAMGLAMVLPQGCKRKPAQVQSNVPVRTTIPQVGLPDGEPLPIDESMPHSSPAPQVRQHPAPIVRVPSAPVDTDEQVEARQRQQDQRLYERQEAASQKAQRELDVEVQRSQKAQDDMQAEPRIQEAPGPPPGFLEDSGSGQDGVRIRDSPPASYAQPLAPAPPQL